MPEALCLDASVLVKLYLPEPGSEDATRLLEWALDHDADLLGPAFVLAEVLSVLRKHAHRGVVLPKQAEAALESLLVLPIRQVDGREVYERAWRIAGELDLPVIYDAVYLAVSELNGVTFWTADRELFERANDRGYLRLLGQDTFGDPEG